MNTQVENGLISRGGLTEVSPDRAPAVPEACGLMAASVRGFIGDHATAAVLDIEHEHMVLGVHFTSQFGHMFYTPEGLMLLIEQLREYGYVGDAMALQSLVARHYAPARPKARALAFARA